MMSQISRHDFYISADSTEAIPGDRSNYECLWDCAKAGVQKQTLSPSARHQTNASCRRERQRYTEALR